MTTGRERALAMIYAGDFLEELATANDIPDILAIKARAQWLLRHYPSNTEIAWVAEVAARSPLAIMGSPLDPTVIPRELQKGYRQW